MTARAGALAALFVVGGALIQAQAPHGYVSVGVDALPNAPVEATEMRARIFAEHTARPSDLITLHVAGYVDRGRHELPGGLRDGRL